MWRGLKNRILTVFCSETILRMSGRCMLRPYELELSTTRKATGCAATQEHPCILCNRKVHYRIHKSTPLVHILSQTNPLRSISPTSNLILSTHQDYGLPSGFFPYGKKTNSMVWVRDRTIPTPQLYSRGWVDPIPDPLLFFSGSAGNRTWASGSVAKNSDH
jgi:hypothetical protein